MKAPPGFVGSIVDVGLTAAQPPPCAELESPPDGGLTVERHVDNRPRSAGAFSRWYGTTIGAGRITPWITPGDIARDAGQGIALRNSGFPRFCP